MGDPIETQSGNLTESRLMDDFGAPVPSSFTADMPFSYSLAFSAVAADTTAGNGTLQAYSGRSVGLNPSSDNTAILLISLGDAQNFQRLLPGQFIEGLTPFDRFFVKRPAALASSALLYQIDVAGPRTRLNYSTTPTPTATVTFGTGTNATQVQGTAADAAAAVGSPVQIGGVDGSGNMQSIAVDTSGRQVVVGAQTAGSAVVAGGVRVQGSDGTNARDLTVQLGGSAAAATVPTLIVGGSDATNARALSVDTSGHPIVVGGAADAATKVGNSLPFAGVGPQTSGGVVYTAAVAPGEAVISNTATNVLVVGGRGDNGKLRSLPINQAGQANASGNFLTVGGINAAGAGTYVSVQDSAATVGGTVLIVGGKDGGSLARELSVDTSGRQVSVGAAATGAAVAGNPVLSAGSDGTNAQSLKVDTSGRQIVVGAAATGAAVAGNPVLSGASDGTNAQALRSSVPTGAQVSGDSLLEVRNTPAWVGVQANAWSAAAVGVGGTSAALDTFGLRFVEAFGNVDAPTNITFQVSQDNSNFYNVTTPALVAATADFNAIFETGARYVRLKSSGAATITATLAAKG